MPGLVVMDAPRSDTRMLPSLRNACLPNHGRLRRRRCCAAALLAPTACDNDSDAMIDPTPDESPSATDFVKDDTTGTTSIATPTLEIAPEMNFRRADRPPFTGPAPKG